MIFPFDMATQLQTGELDLYDEEKDNEIDDDDIEDCEKEEIVNGNYF